ncbi:MAG: helix-turn-helix transcriptional regulator [Spirochaetota bacterium]
MHLIFWIDVFSLLLGSAAVSNALVARRRYRRNVALPFAVLLAGGALIVLGVALQRYRDVIAFADVAGARVGLASFVAVLAGCSAVVCSIPPTIATLSGEVVRGRVRLVLILPGALFIVLAAALAVWPSSGALSVALNVLLFGTSGVGFLALALRYKRIVDPRIRAGVGTVFVALAVFVPLVFVDLAPGVMPPGRVFELLAGAAMPLLASVLFVFSIRFTVRFLLEPAYRDSDGVDEHLRSRFALTDVEAQVAGLLLEGASDGAIVARTGHGARVVERALATLIEKTGVSDRAALIRLINENRAG